MYVRYYVFVSILGLNKKINLKYLIRGLFAIRF